MILRGMGVRIVLLIGVVIAAYVLFADFTDDRL